MDPRLLPLLDSEYALKQVNVLRRLATKGRREAYLLETERGTLVIKITDPGRAEDLVRGDTHILAHATRFDYPAPRLVLTRGGQLYLPLDERFFYLYHFIEGQPPRPSAATLAQTGALLARLHSLPVDQDARASLYRPPYLLDEIRGYMRSAPGDPEQQAMAQEISALLDAFPSFNDLPQGLIHTDPYFVNLIANAHGLHLIDWEDAGLSYPLIDAGYVGHLTTYLPHDRTALGLEGDEAITWRPDWAQAFLDGYQAVRRFSRAERELFPWAVRLNFLVYIWEWDERRIIPENFRRMKLLEQFSPTWD